MIFGARSFLQQQVTRQVEDKDGECSVQISFQVSFELLLKANYIVVLVYEYYLLIHVSVFPFVCYKAFRGYINPMTLFPDTTVRHLTMQELEAALDHLR